ncbi:MAG: hypothetical protein ABGY11_11035 [Candidatus Thioglobus sp.]
MTDYTRIVAWNDKDALADGDAAKIISGDDFWIEFGAVATAVNSKADSEGDSGQAFSTSTAAATSNDTIAASTAYVTSAVSAATTGQNSAATIIAEVYATIYPVGSLYSSTLATNPAAALGGTWAAFGEGKVMVGIASSGTFATAGATGGAETHALSLAEMPVHNHELLIGQTGGNNSDTLVNSGWSVGNYNNEMSGVNNVQLTGGTDSHNNLQPYVVVYMWKRTA